MFLASVIGVSLIIWWWWWRCHDLPSAIKM